MITHLHSHWDVFVLQTTLSVPYWDFDQTHNGFQVSTSPHPILCSFPCPALVGLIAHSTSWLLLVVVFIICTSAISAPMKYLNLCYPNKTLYITSLPASINLLLYHLSLSINLGSSSTLKNIHYHANFCKLMVRPSLSCLSPYPVQPLQCKWTYVQVLQQMAIADYHAIIDPII